MSKIVVIPVEAIRDDRLTDQQRRVLMALYSFNSKKSDSKVWPSREVISSITGLRSLHRITNATTDLVRLGWLKKEGTGGRSRSTRYWLTVPEFLAEAAKTVPGSGTVFDTETVPGSGTVPDTETVPGSGTVCAEHYKTETVPDSGTGIEQSSSSRRREYRGGVGDTCAGARPDFDWAALAVAGGEV